MIPASERVLVLVRLSLGIFFLILGIIGLILPVVPQTIFLLLAAVLLFPKHPTVRKLSTKFGPRFPRLFALLRRFGVDTGAVAEPAHEDSTSPRSPADPM